jgi:RNA 3'-terminal phosphate cyclase (ATP)
MLEIDGSFGEGGGQILRSSLALSMVTGRPFRIVNVRAGRPRPGLAAQHLAAVRAAAEICGAQTTGVELGSPEVVFVPGPVRPGDHHFRIGTAGSTTLLFQTLLPALLEAGGASTLRFEGGTHNPFAPPYDFLALAFVPLVNRMGPQVTLRLDRPGFHPGGGGRFEARIEPAQRLCGIDLPRRGRVRRRRARALVANLPAHIGQRELEAIQRKLGWRRDELALELLTDAAGPGNVVMLEVESDCVTEVFSAFGEPRVPAETVAGRAVRECRRYLDCDVPVGEHLADQLLLPLAVAGAGSFRTVALSRHATTHLELIRRFLEVDLAVEEDSPGTFAVRLSRSST